MRGKLIVVALACMAALPAPATAATKPDCAAKVLKDWSDGRLDRIYPVRCYQSALDRMPDDMRSYTTAPDDIRRALLARLRDARLHERSTPSGRKARETRAPSQAAPSTTRRRAPRREALSSAALPASTPTGIPLPLVVLAAVGSLLLIVGGAGVATRKLRS
jgi:hypothetical protein